MRTCTVCVRYEAAAPAPPATAEPSRISPRTLPGMAQYAAGTDASSSAVSTSLMSCVSSCAYAAYTLALTPALTEPARPPNASKEKVSSMVRWSPSASTDDGLTPAASCAMTPMRPVMPAAQPSEPQWRQRSSE